MVYKQPPLSLHRQHYRADWLCLRTIVHGGMYNRIILIASIYMSCAISSTQTNIMTNSRYGHDCMHAQKHHNCWSMLVDKEGYISISIYLYIIHFPPRQHSSASCWICWYSSVFVSYSIRRRIRKEKDKMLKMSTTFSSHWCVFAWKSDHHRLLHTFSLTVQFTQFPLCRTLAAVFHCIIYSIQTTTTIPT